MARAWLGLLGVAALAAPAAGNGRAPATTSVHVRPGSPDEIYLAATFGLLISRDDGCSFRWVCEENLGYAGTFDPKYVIATDGTIYATTFEGLRVSRDGGCTFVTATAELPAGAPGRVAGMWVDAIALGAAQDVWIATAESGRPNDVFRSQDGGLTFAATGLASTTLWWKSVAVAPSTPTRVFASGYQVAPAPLTQLVRSDDAGTQWAPVALTDVAFGTTPLVLVAAIAPGNPDRVWLRSVGAAAPTGDRLYRSDDAGATWTEVLATTQPIRDVVARATGELFVTTDAAGAWRSPDGLAPLVALVDPPSLGCLADDGAGGLLGCGANWEPDFLALGRSGDAQAWTKLFRFSEMAGPLDCPAGTPQHDLCEAAWPGMVEQYRPTAPACAGPPPADGAPPDAPGGEPPRGCCGTDGRGAAAGGALLLALVSWPARRRGRRARSGTPG